MVKGYEIESLPMKSTSYEEHINTVKEEKRSQEGFAFCFDNQQ